MLWKSLYFETVADPFSFVSLPHLAIQPTTRTNKNTSTLDLVHPNTERNRYDLSTMTWISSSTITLGRGSTTLRPIHLRSSTKLLHRCLTSSSSSRSSSSTTTPDKSHLITTYPSSAFPSGYLVSSTHSGIKSKSPSAPDLGVLISTSPNPCIAAATFTRNVFKAAPVQVSNEVIKKRGGKVKGFVVSSGCANAVTGQRGLEDAWKMSRTVDDHASRVGASEGDEGTLVMSTGVIGQHLPIDKITSSIPHLLSSLSSTPEAWLGLAKSFMTTDTFPKLRTRSFKINDQLVKLVGIDKGAGMIHPNMGPPHGTLLGVIATDARVERGSLQRALGWAVDRSFNSITVDGDMSTNDTVLCLANGAAGTGEGEGEGSSGEAGMREISEEGTPEEYEVFKRELTGFAEELAQLVVRDGEGATKFVTIRVEVSWSLGLWDLRGAGG